MPVPAKHKGRPPQRPVCRMTQDMTIRAVVFDLDDTLYPERDYVHSGYGAVARHLQDSIGRREDFQGWLWNRFLAGQYDRAFNALSDHFRLGLSEEQIGELVSLYREHSPEIRPGAGIVDLLERLGGRCRLAILSDGLLPAQQLKLDALHIAQFFDTVVFTESLGPQAHKPSPAGFEAVAAKLDVPHDACAYVGDNPAKDFAAPNALGWRTIQYRFDGQIHAHKPALPGGQPQMVVTSPEDILAAIGKVGGQ